MEGKGIKKEGKKAEYIKAPIPGLMAKAAGSSKKKAGCECGCAIF